MRLLFVTNKFPPPHEGGSRVYFDNLVQSQPPQDVVVLTNRRPGTDEADAAQPFPVRKTRYLLRGSPSKVDRARIVAEFVHDLARLPVRQGDVIHADSIMAPAAAAWIAKKAFGVPYVVHLFGEELKVMLTGTTHKHAIARGWARRVLKDADGCIVVSDYTAELLEPFGVDRRKVVKIVPMVHMAGRQPAPGPDIELRRRLGIPTESRVVLSVSRLIERKGHDVLLHAFKRLSDEFPDVVLVIAGRGPYRPVLEGIVERLALKERVILAGFVADEDLARLYGGAELFALPHRELADGDGEGCPTVFLEASSYGLPVVGGSACGVRDAIVDGETGAIVDGEDADALAAAMGELLRDRAKARKLGDHGRARVESECSRAAGGRKLAEFSRAILDRRAGG